MQYEIFTVSCKNEALLDITRRIQHSKIVQLTIYSISNLGPSLKLNNNGLIRKQQHSCSIQGYWGRILEVAMLNTASLDSNGPKIFPWTITE